MCSQCVTECSWYGEFLPGWYLYRATKDDGDDWKAGEWGIGQMNDPTVVWAGDILRDPGEQEGPMTMMPGRKEIRDRFFTTVEDFRVGTYMPPLIGYSLIMAATEAGFGYQPRGTRFEVWIVDYMARWIETHPPIENGQPMSDSELYRFKKI